MLSLIFWSLLILVTLKYVLLLLRADNAGEGGILSLVALIQQKTRRCRPLAQGAPCRWACSAPHCSSAMR